MLRSLMLRASRSRSLERAVKRRRFAQRAVRRFMPGETLEDALTAAERLQRRGLGTVFTELGENVSSEQEAAAVADHYVEALRRIEQGRINGEISVKPTHLGLDLGADTARANLSRLVEAAAPGGSTVWVDMEDSSYVDPTLELVRHVRARHSNIGVCLQAYLHRTPDDLASLRDPAVRVRIVKGAYREGPEHAIQRKSLVDQRFQDIAVGIIRDRDYFAAAPPVFGTHDDRLIERIRESARQYGAAPGQLEFHMLYGIGRELQEWLTARGAAVRVLISYGEHWYPWYMRRLAERPANLWFVLRQLGAR